MTSVPPVPVLFVDHAAALGGAEKCLLLLFEHLDAASIVPHLATSAGLLADHARALGVRVYEVPLPRLRRQAGAPWRLVAGAAALTRIVRRERIALIASHSARADLYAALAARCTHCRLVWHVHELVRARLHRRVMCATCDAAVAVSAAVAAVLPRSDKVHVIRNGVRTADFAVLPKDRAAALRRQWGVPADATLVGQVARLQPWKGQRDVIAAAEMVLRERPDLYVVIVGGDVFGDAVAYERALRADVSERGLDGRVVFAGHVTDIVAVLGALDVMVHASPAEPFGTILLEAAAAGVPIVAYDGGGVPELLADEVTALLVPAGDWHALSGGIVRLVDDRRLARALAARAQVTVQRWFDVRPWVRDVQALLLEVAARRGGQVG